MANERRNETLSLPLSGRHPVIGSATWLEVDIERIVGLIGGSVDRGALLDHEIERCVSRQIATDRGASLVVDDDLHRAVTHRLAALDDELDGHDNTHRPVESPKVLIRPATRNGTDSGHHRLANYSCVPATLMLQW